MCGLYYRYGELPGWDPHGLEWRVPSYPPSGGTARAFGWRCEARVPCPAWHRWGEEAVGLGLGTCKVPVQATRLHNSIWWDPIDGWSGNSRVEVFKCGPGFRTALSSGLRSVSRSRAGGPEFGTPRGRSATQFRGQGFGCWYRLHACQHHAEVNDTTSHVRNAAADYSNSLEASRANSPKGAGARISSPRGWQSLSFPELQAAAKT